ncbi:MAG: hypothetical protein AAGK02_13525 [Pseudomonadota bacterium]
MEPLAIRPVLALVLLFSLSANLTAPTREKIEGDAQRILERCKAELLIKIVVVDTTNLEITPIKKPEKRTEADLQALRCVGRQSTSVIDFRPVAQHLLMMRSGD